MNLNFYQLSMTSVKMPAHDTTDLHIYLWAYIYSFRSTEQIHPFHYICFMHSPSPSNLSGKEQTITTVSKQSILTHQNGTFEFVSSNPN